MKIIYRGGYNKLDEESVKKSVIHDYEEVVKRVIARGGRVAFVTLAKPDGHYDEELKDVYGEEIEIIDRKKRSEVNWSEYDLIFLLGGDQRDLDKGLTKSGFGLDALKSGVIVVGDSAGAYVLAAGYFDFVVTPSGRKKVDYHQGFNPQSQLIVLAHVNRIDLWRLKKARLLAKKKELKLLELEENQEKLLDEKGELVDVDKGVLGTTRLKATCCRAGMFL